MVWVYKRTQAQPALYTVGYYDPDWDWKAESDHLNADLAANRVSFLNGNSAAGEAEPDLYVQLVNQLGHPSYLNDEFIARWGSFDTGAFWITKTNLDTEYHVTRFPAAKHDANPILIRVPADQLLEWVRTHKRAIRSVLEGNP